MIQLVIDITEHEWEYLNKLVKNGDVLGHYERLIVNGIPLPKGHGRIADMDEAIKCIEGVVDSKEKQYALYLTDWACSKRVLIEADKEKE